MGTVDVGIRHDDDLVIAELCDVEIIAVALGESAPEGGDHGLDLRVREDLVDAGLLHIQDLAPDRQDRLIVAVPGGLGGSAGGISLDDKDLAL